MPAILCSQAVRDDVLRRSYRRFTPRLRQGALRGCRRAARTPGAAGSGPPDDLAVASDDVLAVGHRDVALPRAAAEPVADPVSRLEPVVAPSALEHVAAGPADEPIVPQSTQEPVGTCATEERVVPTATVEHIRP